MFIVVYSSPKLMYKPTSERRLSDLSLRPRGIPSRYFTCNHGDLTDAPLYVHRLSSHSKSCPQTAHTTMADPYVSRKDAAASYRPYNQVRCPRRPRQTHAES